MNKIAVITSLVVWVLSVRSVGAQPAFDIKYQAQEQVQQEQSIQPPSPSAQSQTTHQEVQVDPTTQQQEGENPLPDQWTQLQNRLAALEGKNLADSGDPQVAGWLSWWWKIGFLGGILLLFPWAFVGWQWAKLGFWDFGWPWPWWFWLPLGWFIPWLVIGWQWWLVWWPGWMWGWWAWPWIFWPIWWLIVFKEAMIWVWKKG